MADEKAPEMDVFAPAAAEEPREYIVLKPGETPPAEEPAAQTPPEKVMLTPEEYAQLKAGTNMAEALKQSIAGLGDKLGRPANAPQTPPGADDAELAGELEKLWDKSQGVEAFKKLSQKLAGPQLAQLQGVIVQQERQIMENAKATAPIFEKYGGEIDQLVGSLPAQQQVTPGVYRWATEQVKAKHAEEMAKESVSQQVADLVDAKLKEMGIDPKTPPKAAAQRFSQERGGPAPKPGKAEYVTAEDKAVADRKGMEVADYMAWKKRTGGK